MSERKVDDSDLQKIDGGGAVDFGRRGSGPSAPVRKTSVRPGEGAEGGGAHDEPDGDANSGDTPDFGQ